MRRIAFDGKELRMVVFDFDGVLYDGDSHSVELAEKLGIHEEVKKIFKDMREGKISVEDAIIKSALCWKGIEVARVLKIMREIKLRKGSKETVEKLKKAGYLTALVSCGGSTTGFQAIKEKLGLDYVYSNSAEVVDGKFTGRLTAPPVDAKEKADLFLRAAKEAGVDPSECAVIGNDDMDIPMFMKAKYSIAINPSERLKKYARIVLNLKDMREILPYLIVENKE
ncbi:MAG: HAD-IB family phosphatase [Candidatus Jordarchaeaceae archaeon]